MAVKNPFSDRNMITDPDEFFGRENELRTIFGNNLFSEVTHGEFILEVITKFLSAISESFGFNEREIQFIYEITNHYPLHL